MNLIEINGDPQSIDFDPAGELEEIIQNVRTILRTTKYTVPLNRGFGIIGDMVDRPIHQAAGFYQQSIIQAINDYEPRVEVQSVSFDESNGADGILRPSVLVKLRS